MIKRIIYITILIISVSLISFMVCRFIYTKVEDVEDKRIDYLPVYGPDERAMEREINFFITMDRNIPLEKKVGIIAEKLERFKFGLPIDFLGIKEVKGKKIARINLKESEYLKRKMDRDSVLGSSEETWRFLYFQGSTGAQFTSYTLKMTFLQPEYRGEWVDGVVFLYEGNPVMQDDWVHLSLSGIIYRDSLREEL